MKQLFYNITGGIVYQIRSEKRTTTSEVIVRSHPRRPRGLRGWFAVGRHSGKMTAHAPLFSRVNRGRFPFDQKFRKFRVWERMEQTFSGISFRNFGCTSRGWPKIPENRNNRKNSVPFDHSCSGLVSPRLEIEFNMSDPQASKHNISALSDKQLKYVTSRLMQWIGLNKL